MMGTPRRTVVALVGTVAVTAVAVMRFLAAFVFVLAIGGAAT